jgi:hypothetical protein
MIALLDQDGKNWPKRNDHVKLFIKKCATCQKNCQKKSMAIENLCRPFTLSSDSPMNRLSIDLIEDLRMDEDGNQHILVLIDSFSRYLFFLPIKEKTAMAIAKALLPMIGDYGAPKTLVSGRDPSQTASSFRRRGAAKHRRYRNKDGVETLVVLSSLLSSSLLLATSCLFQRRKWNGAKIKQRNPSTSSKNYLRSKCALKMFILFTFRRKQAPRERCVSSPSALCCSYFLTVMTSSLPVDEASATTTHSPLLSRSNIFS